MMNKKFFFLFILPVLLVVFNSCNKNEEAQFYYWKTNFELNNYQKELLAVNKTSKLYVKFFDIKYTKPYAKVNFNDIPKDIEIIPCIYITNQNFERDINIKDLAYNTNRLLNEIIESNDINVKEIQIDCDWTVSTKAAYFEFLEKLKGFQQGKYIINCTLRLHQLKYPEKTGIPPVDKVTLMCYNIGDIKDVNEDNSILTIEDVKKYINKKTDYPIDMDFALPIFSWATVYRFDHLADIVNAFHLEDLINNDKLAIIKKNKYKVLENHYFLGTYLYKDDILRYESPSVDDLKETIAYFKNIKNKDSQLIFFDLSSPNAINYSNEVFKSIISKF